MSGTWRRVVIASLCLGAGLAFIAGAGSQPTTWNFSQAHIAAAQQLGDDGAGVTVAVVDGWVDPADFGGRVLAPTRCLNGVCHARSSAPDACAHGTHVAGTIASAQYGVAPAADILPVQVLQYSANHCSGTAGDVALGISWAAEHGAQIINVSLGDVVSGLSQDSAIGQAIHGAAMRGVVVVVSAGRDTVPQPSGYGSDVITVAATGPGSRLASYSQPGGPTPAMAAPGGDSGLLGTCQPSNCIESTLPHGGYGLMQGTGMAAAHVSGTAALLIGQAPERGRAEVVHALESTAHALPGVQYGLLDAAKALQLWSATTPTTTPARVVRPTPARPVNRTAATHSPQATGPILAAPTLPGQHLLASSGHGGIPLIPVVPSVSPQPGPAAAAEGQLTPSRTSRRGGLIAIGFVLITGAVVGFIRANQHGDPANPGSRAA